jgi:transcriptional regulator with XRE-family HTH domain
MRNLNRNGAARSLAENVKRWRIGLGMTQEQAARKLKISRATLTRIEGCHQNTTLMAIDKIANGIKMPVRELF